MRDLTDNEISDVSGGLILEVFVAVGGLLAFGYSVGKDLAERDNALHNA